MAGEHASYPEQHPFDPESALMNIEFELSRLIDEAETVFPYVQDPDARNQFLTSVRTKMLGLSEIHLNNLNNIN